MQMRETGLKQLQARRLDEMQVAGLGQRMQGGQEMSLQQVQESENQIRAEMQGSLFDSEIRELQIARFEYFCHFLLTENIFFHPVCTTDPYMLHDSLVCTTK